MNKVDLAVLGFLMRQPMHGYQIGEFFEKRGIEFWIKLKMPSVYKALNRLEDKGYISGRAKIDENNRTRKVYSITSSGREYFQQLLNEIFFSERFISSFDFWNAFRFLYGNSDKEYFTTLVSHRLKQMKDHREEMRAKRHCKENDLNLETIPFYLKRLFNHFKDTLKAEENLLNEMLKEAEFPENQEVFNKNKGE